MSTLTHQTAPILTIGNERSGITSVAQDVDDFFLCLTGIGANPQ